MHGSVISWAEAVPAGSESVGLGDNRIRSMKTDLRTALDDEHVFPSSGGTAGQHRAGSARAFYGTQSQVSASTTSAPTADGRMMLTSDTSRLFGVGSGGTVLLGGAHVASVGSFTPISWPQRKHLAFEMGVADSDVNGRYVVTFPNSGFSDVPFIYLQSLRTYATGNEGLIPTLFERTTSEFSAVIYKDSGGTVSGGGTQLSWIAFGSRAL